MRTIVLLDITIADTNLGNTIIMSAVEKHLRQIFPQDFFIRVSSFDGLGPRARELVGVLSLFSFVALIRFILIYGCSNPGE